MVCHPRYSFGLSLSREKSDGWKSGMGIGGMPILRELDCTYSRQYGQTLTRVSDCTNLTSFSCSSGKCARCTRLRPRLGFSKGITPVSQRICFPTEVLDTMGWSGETEPSSAGTQLGKGYPGLRCAQSASGPCRLTLSGALFFECSGFFESSGTPEPCLKNPFGGAAFPQRRYVNVRTSRMNPFSTHAFR